MFRVEHPASILFTDIDGLCKLVTRQTYREIFKNDFNSAEVRDTEELIASRNVSRTEDKAALRFILDQFCSYDSFILQRYQLGQPRLCEDYQQATQTRRDELMKNIRSYAKVTQQEERNESDLASTSVSLRLLEAGFRVERHDELVPVRTLQEAHNKLKRLKTLDQSLKSRLQPFRQMLGDRILDALEFLRAEQVVQAIREDDDVATEAINLLNVWALVTQLRPVFDSFFFEVQVNTLLLEIGSQYSSRRFDTSLKAAASRLNSLLVQIQQSTTEVLYPFEHGLGQVSVSHYLLPELPAQNDIVASLDAAVDLEQNLEYLLRRSIARLGALAEKVERVFGFEPMEPPPEVKKS